MDRVMAGFVEGVVGYQMEYLDMTKRKTVPFKRRGIIVYLQLFII
jgi:hypothetical protein